MPDSNISGYEFMPIPYIVKNKSPEKRIRRK